MTKLVPVEAEPDELPTDPARIGPELAHRLLSGKETPGRLAKSTAAGALGLPSSYLNLGALLALGSSFVPAHIDAKTQMSIAEILTKKAEEQKQWSRRTAGLPDGPKTAYERAGEHGGAALVDPLSYLWTGVGLPKRIGFGLAPSVGASIGLGEVLEPAPEARVVGNQPPTQAATSPAVVPASSPPKGLVEEEAEAPAAPGLVETEAPARGWNSVDYGLGVAGAVAAALLARKGLRAVGLLEKPVPGKALESIGQPLDAKVPRQSATTPGELIATEQADSTAVVRSQVARSTQGLPPGAPIETMQQTGRDVYTTGIPDVETFGSRQLLLPNSAPTIPAAPFAPGTTIAQAVKDTDALIPRSTPAQVGLRMSHGFETGQIDIAGGTRSFQIIPPKKQLTDWAMAGPDVAKNVDEALGLGRALDAAEKGSAPILTRLFGPKQTTQTAAGVPVPHPFPGKVDPAMLAQQQARYTQLMADPKVYEIVTGIQGNLRAMIQNAVHAGIPQSKVNQFLKANPRFVPIQEQGKEARNPNLLGRMDRFFRELGEVDPHMKDSMAKFDDFMTATKVHGQGVQNPASFADTYQRYFATYYYAMERNHAKRSAFYFIRNSRDPLIAQSFSVYRKGDKGAPATTNWFWDGEALMGVHFKDPLMNTAFKLNPHDIKWQTAHKMKQGFQQGTTGLLNPTWLFLKGVFFDHGFGAALRPAGSKDFGGISGILTAGRGRISIDPTKVAHNLLAGMGRTLAAKGKLAIAEAAEQALARNLGPMWSKWYEAAKGPGSVKRLAQTMRDAYVDSTYAWAKREGVVGQTQFFERNLAMNTSRLEQMVPAWSKLGYPVDKMHSIYMFYKNLMESAAQSYKIQYMHYNRARPGVAKEAADLLGTFTRRGIGKGIEGTPLLREAHDLSQQAGNVAARAFGGRYAREAGQALMDSIPYYNVFIQATNKLAKRMASPSGASGLLQSAILPAVAAQLYMSYDKELSDWYRQLPGQYRASTLFMPLPFMQHRPVHERVLAIPIAPEFGILHAVTSYAMAEFLGTNTSYQQDDIRDSISQWLNVPFIGGAGMPPLVVAFGALGGLDLRGSRVQSFEGSAGFGPNPLSLDSLTRKERSTGAGFAARPGAALPAEMEGFMQGLFGTVASFAIGGLDSWTQAARRKEDPGLATITHLGNETLRKMPVYKPIHGFHAEQAMSNMKRRLGEKGQLIDRISNTAEALMRGGRTSIQRPAENYLQPEQLQSFMRDPVYMQRILAVKRVFELDPALKRVQGDRNILRRELESLGGQRPLTRELQQKINVLRARELGLSERLYDLVKAKEQRLGFRLEDVDPARVLSKPPGTGPR